MCASPLKPIQLFINWDFTSRLIILLACMLNIRGYGSSFFQKSFPFDISVGSVARLMIFKCFFISWYRCRDMNSWMRYNKIFADQYSCSFGNRANPIRSRIPRKISISAPVIYLHLGVREHGSCAKLCLAALIYVFAAMVLRVINSWKSCNGRSKEVISRSDGRVALALRLLIWIGSYLSWYVVGISFNNYAPAFLWGLPVLSVSMMVYLIHQKLLARSPA